WLDDKPIRARRPSLLQKAKKWARRHRGVTLSAGVSGLVVLLLTVAGVSLGVVAGGKERQRASPEQGRAKGGLARETARRQQLRRTLDALSSPLIDSWLAKQPVIQPEHKQFLEQALALYEGGVRPGDRRGRAGPGWRGKGLLPGGRHPRQAAATGGGRGG